MPEKVFRNMGYRNDTGFVIPCCDEWGYKVEVRADGHGVEQPLQRKEYPYHS